MAILHLALLSITVYEKFENLSSCLVNLVASLVNAKRGTSEISISYFHSMSLFSKAILTMKTVHT
jgi:hypothetical protein